ncbi:UPF0721 transmembrane protein [Agaricicola taiwanensis]|uniref:Probable membrane transporter protein n=1 Tax=Agaricicola taiwanensis TaxID=591372 RepID=A0A8J3DYA6_9RHOB|nr:TSUP family transporter [Agaricicola taiwanensis]GGE46999.1 UPF0721 transmembrane protein [Agaricicola taiwanensis]
MISSAIDLEILALLFCVAVVAACFDAIAGGGGLMTVPSLMLAGLDPAAAIATNKLLGAAGTCSSTYAFARRGLIDWRQALFIAPVAALAAIAGALCVSRISPDVLAAIIPLLLIGIAIYFATAPRMTNEDAVQRIPKTVFIGLFVPVVAFYDGLFGPGAGSFYMIGFVALLGYGVLRATAHTKLANAVSNLGGLALFASSGLIVWQVGLLMALGSLIGAQLGSLLAVRFGARIIRPLLVVIACLMALRLLADPQNPLRQAVSGLWM